jgi:hypothetical protein
MFAQDFLRLLNFSSLRSILAYGRNCIYHAFGSESNASTRTSATGTFTTFWPGVMSKRVCPGELWRTLMLQLRTALRRSHLDGVRDALFDHQVARSGEHEGKINIFAFCSLQ